MSHLACHDLTRCICYRINVKTGKVKRECLFGDQRNDHPRVNPSFYSKPTRYVYVNACMPEDGNVANPPQVCSSQPCLRCCLRSLPLWVRKGPQLLLEFSCVAFCWHFPLPTPTLNSAVLRNLCCCLLNHNLLAMICTLQAHKCM